MATSKTASYTVAYATMAPEGLVFFMTTGESVVFTQDGDSKCRNKNGLGLANTGRFGHHCGAMRAAVSTHLYTKSYRAALSDANEMMMESEGLEPTSALKQAASDRLIPFGEHMQKFVRWANEQWGIESV